MRKSASLVSPLLLAGVASAQTATALLVEDGPLPGAPGQTITSLNNPAVNHVGGYAVALNADNGGTAISHVWGNAAGGAGSVLRSEGTIGAYVQTSFESFYGISDTGQVAYSPSANDTVGGFTGLDGVWLDDTIVAIERDPVTSIGGQFWSFGSRPGVTADGMPYWVGGITSSAGGSTQNRGMFLGLSQTPILLGNQSVPNLPLPLDPANTVSFDYRFSAHGTHHIAEVQLLGATSTTNTAMVVDGEGLLVDGSLVREGSPIPAAAGGMVGENWTNFDFEGINDGGSWFFTGDSNAATSVDEAVIRDGTIVLREGDVVSGQTLAGDIEGASMNEDGDLAITWDVSTGQEVLILNGEIVLSEGDAVDFDGDGVAEPNAKLADFTGISSLVLGDRRPNGTVDLYFTADIDFNGTTSTTDDLEGFFRLRRRVAPPSGHYLLTNGFVSTGGKMAVASEPLVVAAGEAGPPVEIAPADLAGAAGGRGTFTRAYAPGTQVTLSLPAATERGILVGWLVNGQEVLDGSPLHLTLDAPTTVVPLWAPLAR